MILYAVPSRLNALREYNGKTVYLTVKTVPMSVRFLMRLFPPTLAHVLCAYLTSSLGAGHLPFRS